MTKKVENHKVGRRHHTAEFRAEALTLAEKIGVAAAARDLELHESQIYDWRSKAQAQLVRSDLEKQQAAEITRLKRRLADKDEEVEILKKLRRISLENCPDSTVAKYEFVEEFRSAHSTTTLCRLLNLSRSGFYAWQGQCAAGRTRQGLRAKAAKKFKVTTDSNHTNPVAPNLLAQNLMAESANQKWCGDITCLWTE